MHKDFISKCEVKWEEGGGGGWVGTHGESCCRAILLLPIKCLRLHYIALRNSFYTTFFSSTDNRNSVVNGAWSVHGFFSVFICFHWCWIQSNELDVWREKGTFSSIDVVFPGAFMTWQLVTVFDYVELIFYFVLIQKDGFSSQLHVFSFDHCENQSFTKNGSFMTGVNKNGICFVQIQRPITGKNYKNRKQILKEEKLFVGCDCAYASIRLRLWLSAFPVNCNM